MQRLNRIGNAFLWLPILYGMAVIASAVWKYHSGANTLGKAAGLGTFGLIVCAVFLAARRLAPPTKTKLSLLVITTGGGLLLLECALAYIQRIPRDSTQEGAKASRREAATKLGQEFDNRTKREVVLAMRAEGIPAVPTFQPEYFFLKAGFIDIDGKHAIPLGGVANRRTVFCNESGEWLTYQSDEHGFHNPKGLYTPGKVDVVAVGDSFTIGQCVCSDENFVARVRKKHPATINLGAAGNGPLCSLAALTEYAKPLRAKNVIWCYYEGNDLLDLSREKKSLLIRYLQDPSFSADLLSHQPAIDRDLLKIIDAELKKPAAPAEGQAPENEIASQSQSTAFTASTILQLARVRTGLGDLLRGSSRLAAQNEVEINLLKEVLRSAKERTERFGGKLYFVYLPAYERFARLRYPSRHGRIKEIVAEVNLPFIDIDQAFRDHGDPLALFPFRIWGHYTRDGHRIVGEAILEALDGKPSR
jgi:hypothetical protein